MSLIAVEIGKYIDQAIPLVEYGEISIKIKIEKGKPVQISKLLQENERVRGGNDDYAKKKN